MGDISLETIAVIITVISPLYYVFYIMNNKLINTTNQVSNLADDIKETAETALHFAQRNEAMNTLLAHTISKLSDITNRIKSCKYCKSNNAKEEAEDEE